MNHEPRPLLIYAQLDSDSAPRWWLRLADGRWADVAGIGGNAPVRIVASERLAPVKADYHRDVGDARAVSEVYSGRETKCDATNELMAALRAAHKYLCNTCCSTTGAYHTAECRRIAALIGNNAEVYMRGA